jgi:methionyl-tRNA synthetase
MYVWVDALTNYITATGFPDDGPRAHFWPADAHVIGKDITRFHAIYWPAFLMSAQLPLPKQIVVHGFLFNRGEKMSKSVGNVVSPADLVTTYGLDPVRYFFLRETPWGQDGNYSHELIVARMNADLANDLGNLAQRSLSIVARNGAAVPALASPTPADLEMLALADGLVGLARGHMQAFQIHLYIGAVMDAVAAANRYFANAEPWKLAKTDPARAAGVLYVTLETLRIAAILLQPVMPSAMTKLLDLLAVPPDSRTFAQLAGGPVDAPQRLQPGVPLPPPSAIFPRYAEA